MSPKERGEAVQRVGEEVNLSPLYLSRYTVIVIMYICTATVVVLVYIIIHAGCGSADPH